MIWNVEKFEGGIYILWHGGEELLEECGKVLAQKLREERDKSL